MASLQESAQRLFDIHATIEDLVAEITDGEGNPKSKVMESYVGILQSLLRLVDVSNAQEDENMGAWDKIKDRLGKAYGIYLKLLGISNANKDKNKDIENINSTLGGLSDKFKTVLTDLGSM